MRWQWQILHGMYQIINNHRVPYTRWNCTYHTCAICLPCCRGMSHNVATNWLFRICLKHGCSIHLSYHLVCYNYSNTKLTKKWIFSLYSLVHEIFLDIMRAIIKGNLHVLVGLRWPTVITLHEMIIPCSINWTSCIGNYLTTEEEMNTMYS